MRIVTGLGAIVLMAFVCNCSAASPNGSDEHSVDRKAWQGYEQSVFDALAASQDPRDWALASVMRATVPDKAVGDKAGDLISRAAAALPDDAPTQWLAMQECASEKEAAGCDEALTALERIESDNAAVWMQALNRAAHRRDAVGVEVALERMAASTHFDDHVIALTQRFAAAFLNLPPGATFIDAARSIDRQASAELLAKTAASAFTFASSLPSYQHLMRACTIDPERGLHVERSADCEKIGRMLGEHGPNLVANGVGFGVLRVSHTWNAADARAAREWDWLISRTRTPALQLAMVSARGGAQYLEDWSRTGSELGAIRLAVQRADVNTTPPSDWVDNSSPFSEKRLADDRRYAAERAANLF